VASTVHDEGGFSGDGAVFANDEFVTNKVEMVQNIVKKALWAIRVIVICVVPDDDVRVGAIIFDEGYLREPFHRVLFVGLWSIHGKNLLQAAVLSNGWMLAPYRKMRMGSLKPSFEIRVSLILSV